MWSQTAFIEIECAFDILILRLHCASTYLARTAGGGMPAPMYK